MTREFLGDCVHCPDHACHHGKDCWEKQDTIAQRYQNGQDTKIWRAAAEIEAQGYCRLNRLQELLMFCNKMNYRIIGLAFCVGVIDEAKIFVDTIGDRLEIISVCCKVCSLNKDDYNLMHILTEKKEYACNPIGQAEFLNQRHTDLNIIFGLCMGHDIVFNNNSKAPVTTFLVKDRVLAHNPGAALYCQYVRKRI
ncbi:MAG: hypothetical protein A2161_13370 [Candidatus Schekmanbacteria bacterium RBG_13_48_7]|uniref:Metal-binding protein n=1 Tax=Candidatus Schekmanbacteria bacterium RBG_13_48_7 TaxID=1817878 RepID=A0A1F7RQ77_9BACT|nr:MAG: hypothetical protein A2161_13370 [Candidatus Schekmanbacteria bacterium RBG_13_48_7]